jgi:hypothetical protein
MPDHYSTGTLNFEIINMNGQQILSQRTDGGAGSAISLNVSGIPAGVYSLRIFNEQVCATGRLVKE